MTTVTPLHRGELPCASGDSLHGDDAVMDLRAALLRHIEAGLGELTRAAAVLDDLRQPATMDTGMSYGRDGRDTAALIDIAIRNGRSAFAVMQMVFAGEGPRL